MSSKSMTTGTFAGIALVIIGAAAGSMTWPRGTPLHLEVRDAVSGRPLDGPVTVQIPEGVDPPLETVIRGPRVFLRYEGETPPAVKIGVEGAGARVLEGVPDDIDPIGVRAFPLTKGLLDRFK